MAPTDLSAASLDQIEQQLLADLEAVRRMRALLTRQPLNLPTGALPALPPAQAPPAAANPVPATPALPPPPEASPPPRHPNWNVSDVRVAVRQVIDTLTGTFNIGDVKKQLAKQHYRTFGDSTIRATLQALQEKGEILLAARGLGRGGNKFSKPAPAIPPESKTI